MGYYTGSANDMGAVHSALVAACVAEGWAWNGTTEVLSKGAMFLKLQVVTGYLTLLGRTSATAGDMTQLSQIGPFAGAVAAPLPAISWPLNYEVFVFEQEVYCVINYAVDCYQWCAWGKSTIEGLPGTGMWVGATASGRRNLYTFGAYINATSGASDGGNGSSFCPALFWTTQGGPGEAHVHSDLDSQGWWMGQSVNAVAGGIAAVAPLMAQLPNAWNSEAVLLPIRGYKTRVSNKVSITVDLEHARYARIDHYSPGQIISIGSVRWKIFPWFRKNSASRNGGSGLNHSGTFGWAIRYEGP